MNLRDAFNEVFTVEFAIAVGVFAIVCLVLAFALFRYRAGREHVPSRTARHRVLEPLYAAILVVIAICLVVFTATVNEHERSIPSHPDMKIEITAFQWCWSFHYLGTPVTVSGTCIKKAPVLELPVHETIEVLLTSNDVIHEWWSPYLRFKMEAFPHHINTFSFNLGQIGEWPGQCSTYCGLYHYRMDFELKAVSKETFKAFLAAHEPVGAAA